MSCNWTAILGDRVDLYFLSIIRRRGERGCNLPFTVTEGEIPAVYRRGFPHLAAFLTCLFDKPA
jgi:hypothetical protein